MNYKRNAKLCSIITFILAVMLLCGFSFLGSYAAEHKVDTNKQLQSMKSATTVLNEKQNITTIDIQATIGNVMVLYGNKSQIEIGSELLHHASFSYENGMLIYRDDFVKHNLSFDDMNSEAYKIVLTIPNRLKVETLSVDVGVGSIDLQNIMADDTKLTGAAKINLDGFQSGTLVLQSTLAEVSAADIFMQKGFSLHSYGSKAIVSGDIQGDILIDSAGISNTDITLINSDRANYAIKSTWEPESPNKESGNFLPESSKAGILIDGEMHNMEYEDSNLEAPYQLTIISRELMPMDNIVIRFVK